METQIIDARNAQAIETALAIIRSGEAVAFPTDTVYGVGVLAFDTAAIDKLFEAKIRDPGKAIPILLGDPAQLSRVARDVPALALRLAQRFWPGPLTLVVPSHPGLPPNLSPAPTVGVRMPDHPVALALLRRSGPLAVTSANLSGEKNAIRAQEVLAQLGGRIPLILDGGRTPGGSPSTVVDCTGQQPVILRPGPLSLEALKAALSG